MPQQKTSPDKPAEQGITVAQWTVGDGAKQVPVAGLLASDPKLQTAELTPDEWEKKLAAYLKTPDPFFHVPDDESENS